MSTKPERKHSTVTREYDIQDIITKYNTERSTGDCIQRAECPWLWNIPFNIVLSPSYVKVDSPIKGHWALWV